ncbi:TonB-dependent receptor plug domain-containing protein [Sulfurimonas paralvinellae]|uniref:TonB-dependent receptor n=1 Tax=Sulfurimonas paralvinellae TaxID=317658 RepID=A0A7M1B599_9BACT|nr:TonB-dependent receptor [Sulfurimonas paralvinellae]QOP44850.1 TonB-dependent receptor [Sulfurimonas paralvinellae]
MQRTIQLSLISVALLAGTLQAQNQYTLNNIEVSTSQGTALNKKDVTDSVTVITKEEIEDSRVTTLNEALHKLANMPMTQNGGPGTSSSIYLRGMSSKRILVLIDGVRYNNPTAIGATAEFSQIMLNNVEQIEIIKGAQSGVWGSDASGGVINIITSKAKKGLHTNVNMEYGAYDTLQTSLTASYATKKYDFLASGTYFDNDGFSAAEPTQSETNYGKRYDDLGLEKDSYENKTLNTKFGYNITDNDRVEANIQAINSLVHYDKGAGTANDSTVPNTYLQNRFYTLALKHKDTLNNITLQYNLSTFKRDVTYVDWFTSLPATTNYKGSVNEIKLDDKIDYMKDSFLRVGASYQKFKQTDITPNVDKSYSAIAVYGTNYNKLHLLADNNTIITESVRYDKYNNFDNSLTGKLGIKQFLKDDLYISANIGSGYNAPTLGQLYGQWGANPNLKPEKSKTSDITFGNDTVWVTGFYNEITDLIDYDWTLGYIQISGISKFKGVELGYEDFYFDFLGVKALYTYLDAKDADNKNLARRPKSQLDVTATYYATDDIDFGVNAQYIGTRYDKADNQGAQTGKYTVANFVTNVRANKNLTFYAKIDNITDKYYQTVDGYATAGRSAYVGLNLKY